MVDYRLQEMVRLSEYAKLLLEVSRRRKEALDIQSEIEAIEEEWKQTEKFLSQVMVLITLFSRQKFLIEIHKIWRQWISWILCNRSLAQSHYEKWIFREINIRTKREAFQFWKIQKYRRKINRKYFCTLSHRIQNRSMHNIWCRWKNQSRGDLEVAVPQNSKIMYCGFRKWIAHLEKTQRSKSITSRFHHRWMRIHMSQALSIWHNLLSAGLETDSVYKRMRRIWIIRSINCMFAAWKEFVQIEEMLESEASRIFQRSKSSSLLHFWSAWTMNHYNFRSLRQACGRIIFKMQNALAIRFLEVWKARIDIKVRMRRLLNIMTGKGQELSSKKILDAWALQSDCVQNLNECKCTIQSKHRTKVCRRLLLQWQLTVHHVSKLRFLSHQFCSYKQLDLQASAFDHWKAACQCFKLLKGNEKKKCNRITQISFLCKWRLNVRDKKCGETLTLKVCARFTDRKLRNFLRVWCWIMSNQRIQNQLCQRMLIRLQVKSSLYLATVHFKMWESMVVARKEGKCQQNRTCSRLLRKQLKHWTRACKMKSFDRHQVNKASRTFYVMACGNVLAIWSSWRVFHAHLEKVQRRMKVHFIVFTIRRFWCKWIRACICYGAGNRRHIRSILFSKKKQRDQERVFCSWKRLVYTRKIQKCHAWKLARRCRISSLVQQYGPWLSFTKAIFDRREHVKFRVKRSEQILQRNSIAGWWDYAVTGFFDRSSMVKRTLAMENALFLAQGRLIKYVCNAWAVYAINCRREQHQLHLMQRIGNHLRTKSQLKTNSQLMLTWQTTVKYRKWKENIKAESAKRSNRAALAVCLATWKLKYAQAERMIAAHRVVSCA